MQDNVSAASPAPAAPLAPAVASRSAQAAALAAERRKLFEHLSSKIPATALGLADETLRAQTEKQIADAMKTLGITLSDSDRPVLTQLVMDELLGFGPIQPLLDDPSVTEIMVNRADRVYVERKGKPFRTDICFDDDAHLRRVIERIIAPLGKKVDENNPLVDARLPDGSRVNAVVTPVAVAGACLTIRKFGKARLTLDHLVEFGSMTPLVAQFLRGCVIARMNVVVTGGTGSGKTTLLNALSGCIPEDERIVTIEDAAELRLAQDHVITLEARQPDRNGQGGVSIRELVRNALRMRPERIVVGECRGGEALDMLQAMNTGHDGSLTTLHANSPRDALSRIETMALMAGIDFPIRVIREQIGSAVQLLVHQARLRDGSRKITHIVEVAGMEGEKVVLTELFRWQDEGVGPDGKLKGTLKASGLRPQFFSKLESHGLKIPAETFMPNAPVARPAKAA
ncbi:MAG TPA: CpaF family protein [Tepidisphaeraceae bacterium]|jgi:pilus assembly protein CpaF|nr:CpaF family protein [Tepidisphaeraceae bacterium]